MFNSGGSEILCRGTRINVGLTVLRKARSAGAKAGSSEPESPVDGDLVCQTSYPGGNRLVAGKST